MDNLEAQARLRAIKSEIQTLVSEGVALADEHNQCFDLALGFLPYGAGELEYISEGAANNEDSDGYGHDAGWHSSGSEGC